MKNKDQRSPQFNLGAILRSNAASYELTQHLGSGAWGDAYCAKVRELNDESVTFKVDQDVVLKTPALDPRRGFQEKMARMAETYATLMREFMGHDRLQGLSCVAAILDVGQCTVNLGKPALKLPALFVVQRLVPGSCLRQYFEKIGGSFRGFSDPHSYLKWCRMLACALLQVHQRLVVHGDIWPDNIMVDVSDPSRPHPVLIDFGLADFRELTTGASGPVTQSAHPYLAPEGGGSVSADIYALGGVFYYLAVGQDPPLSLRSIQDLDELKSTITHYVPRTLADQNCGILDVITRCLRHDPHARIPHAEGVLQDIETFLFTGTVGEQLIELPRPCDACNAPPSEAAPVPQRIATFFHGLEDKRLFHRMAQQRLRGLLRDVEDMASGVYDLVGDHEAIVAALSQYLSILAAGDSYLTVSLPSFWRSHNLGVNGRFLAMNRLVAENGAEVQRVFLLTREELEHDQEVQRILSAHARVMHKIPWRDKSTESPAWGYRAAYKIIESSERERLIRSGRHFGLLTKGESHILLFPLYRSDGILSAMQFRTAIDHKELARFFYDLLREGTLLVESGG